MGVFQPFLWTIIIFRELHVHIQLFNINIIMLYDHHVWIQSMISSISLQILLLTIQFKKMIQKENYSDLYNSWGNFKVRNISPSVFQCGHSRSIRVRNRVRALESWLAYFICGAMYRWHFDRFRYNPNCLSTKSERVSVSKL